MRLELKEFIEATKSMHRRSGVKRTRLMLHLRPYDTHHTVTVKATDGHLTLTSRVAHQGQLKMLEGLVNSFVQRCTAATQPGYYSTGSHTATTPNTAAVVAAEKGTANTAAAAATPAGNKANTTAATASGSSATASGAGKANKATQPASHAQSGGNNNKSGKRSGGGGRRNK